MREVRTLRVKARVWLFPHFCVSCSHSLRKPSPAGKGDHEVVDEEIILTQNKHEYAQIKILKKKNSFRFTPFCSVQSAISSSTVNGPPSPLGKATRYVRTQHFFDGLFTKRQTRDVEKVPSPTKNSPQTPYSSLFTLP